MTRKDYVKIAAIIKDLKTYGMGAMQDAKSTDSESHWSGYYAALIDVTERVAQVLAADNERFDMALFYAACTQ